MVKSLHTKFQTGVFALAALSILAASPVAAQSNRDLSVEQSPIAGIGEGEDSPRSDIRVAAWLDRRDGVYAPGDELKIFVKSNTTAYITVVDIGTSGKVHVIFPNKFQRENRLQAHEVAAIPPEDSDFRIRVGGPAGREVIKVIATKRPLEYFDLKRLIEAGPYYDVPGESKTIARDLNVELRERNARDFGVATQIIRITGRSSDYRRDGGDDNAEALYRQAERIYQGEGGSMREAFALFERAANAGFVPAMVRLGEIIEKNAENNGRIDEAVNWYMKAANQGNTQAMLKLARAYGTGRVDGRPNYTEALAWLGRAAKAGDGTAMVRLAKAFDEGQYVARNPSEAARYVLDAVKAGAWSVQNEMPQFSQETREEVQKLLQRAGFYDGPIDGVFGNATRSALTEYARAA